MTVDGTELAVSIPADANPSQVAAITSAVGAHVSDRQRAAVAAAAADDVDYTDQWTLAARLDRFGKRHRPQNVERGEEWVAAARAQY
ncbi:hypothetical protein ACFQH8_12185 [Halomicroarcula sp. GCM10025710]